MKFLIDRVNQLLIGTGRVSFVSFSPDIKFVTSMGCQDKIFEQKSSKYSRWTFCYSSSMKSIHSDIQLLRPNVDRDALFAHSWFTRPEGRETLLSMGNAESQIKESTLEGEREIMQEFLDLEQSRKQITRAIVIDKVTIGVVWIELFENHGVKSPSIHIMIGNPDYRGKGIGRAVMQSAIDYIRDTFQCKTIYTRHIANNTPVAKLNESLGFERDGEPYEDENGLMWQNIVMTL